MKAKIKRGKNFHGCISYLLRAQALPEIIGGNLAGMNASEIAREFVAASKLRPDIQKPVWHSPLSLPAGEKLSDEKWNKIAREYLLLLGFDINKTPYILVRHSNTKFDHVHIAASRVNFDRGVYLGQNEHLRATRITQDLEKKLGLVRTRGPDQRAERKALTSQEMKMSMRTGKPPPRLRLQDAIHRHTQDGPTVETLIQRLQAEGIIATPNISKSGKMNGFRFELDSVNFKGSQLGQAFGWQGLIKRGVETADDRMVRHKNQQLARQHAIDCLTKSGDHEAEIGSVKRTRYLLAVQVHKLANDDVKLPTEQIKSYLEITDHDELTRELFKLRKINRQKKERGPRILSR